VTIKVYNYYIVGQPSNLDALNKVLATGSAMWDALVTALDDYRRGLCDFAWSVNEEGLQAASKAIVDTYAPLYMARTAAKKAAVERKRRAATSDAPAIKRLETAYDAAIKRFWQLRKQAVSSQRKNDKDVLQADPEWNTLTDLLSRRPKNESNNNRVKKQLRASIAERERALLAKTPAILDLDYVAQKKAASSRYRTQLRSGFRGEIIKNFDTASKAGKVYTKDGEGIDFYYERTQDGVSNAQFSVSAFDVPVDLCEQFTNKKRTIKAQMRLGPGNVTEFVFKQHRPLPADAKIAGIRLCRDRVGHRINWSIQFTIHTADCYEPAQNTDEVGFDFGWRRKPDGSLRVAYWSSRIDAGEIAIPAHVLSKRAHLQDIKSVSDKCFNEMLASVRSFAAANAVPEWLVEELKMSAAWHSHVRLTQLAELWETRRFEGDSDIYYRLNGDSKKHAITKTAAGKTTTHHGYVGWVARDRHFQTWFAEGTRKLIRWRKQFYAGTAKTFCDRFGVVKFEDTEIPDLCRRAPVEDRSNEGILKMWAFASPGELRDAFQSRANVFQRVSAPYTTQVCQHCQAIVKFGAPLVATCPGCGEVLDQDQNASVNVRDSKNITATFVRGSGQKQKKKRFD
jgi:hypothetical protein